jgi:hypothetical protein
VSYHGQPLPRARRAKPLAFDGSDLVPARTESCGAAVAQTPFKRCAAQIEIGLPIPSAIRTIAREMPVITVDNAGDTITLVGVHLSGPAAERLPFRVKRLVRSRRRVQQRLRDRARSK